MAVGKEANNSHSSSNSKAAGPVNPELGLNSHNNGAIGKVMDREATTVKEITANRATGMAIGAVGINSITISIGVNNSHPVKHRQLVAKL